MAWRIGRAGLALLVVAVTSIAAEARHFRSDDVQGATSPTVRAVANMAERLKERTNGRLGIDIGTNDRDSENFIVGQVQTGLLDMARVNLSVFNSTLPSTIVPSLPFVFRSPAHMRRVLDGPLGRQILLSMEGRGLIGLCFYDAGARSFYSKKPIRRVADMEGLAVRAQPSDATTEMIRAMGARPVAMPFDHVGAALKAGVLEVVEGTWPGYVAAGHERVAPYFNVTEHSMMPSVLVFSRKIWIELSGDEQTAIRAAATDSVMFLRRHIDSYEAEARLEAEANGAQVIDDVDRKSFADVLVPLYPTLAPEPRLQAMLRQAQSDDDVASEP
jgi:TRAP-type C4-dicarboxylate transport system substrate-binding protein